MLDQGYLREEFVEYTVSGPVMPERLLTDIMMVGAEPDFGSDNEENGYFGCYDIEYLKGALHDLHDLSIPVAEQFRVSVVNMAPEWGGEDFLAPEFNRSCDVLIICHIPKDGALSHAQFFTPFSPQNRTSGYDNGIDAWHKAALKTGAKAVIACGGKSEVGENDFKAPDFRGLRRQFDMGEGPKAFKTGIMLHLLS